MEHDKDKQINFPAIVHKEATAVEIKYPKEPIEIGKTVVDGNIQPVWVDPKDFIRTGEQNDELAENIFNSKLNAALELAYLESIAKTEAWLERVMQQIMPATVYTNSEQREAWLKAEDINVIEDWSQTRFRVILRHGMSPISEFNCDLKPVNK